MLVGYNYPQTHQAYIPACIQVGADFIQERIPQSFRKVWAMEDIENFQVKELFLQLACFVYETNLFAFLLGWVRWNPTYPKLKTKWICGGVQ